MSGRIHCPECEGSNVECVSSPRHGHVCHDCGYSTPPVADHVALAEAADWIVHTLAIPHDAGTDTPPPPALRNAILRAVHEDRTGKLHGNELTFPQVVAWINDETDWNRLAQAARS